MSREAREQRDFDLLPKAKKRRLKEQADSGRRRDEKKEDDQQNKPGRKGFVMRARVPMPSNQDYVVRPKVKQIRNLMKIDNQNLTCRMRLWDTAMRVEQMWLRRKLKSNHS